MGVSPKLRLWRFYPNPIRRHQFSMLKWGLIQTFGKIRDALTIRQPKSIEDRRAAYRRYDELYESERIDFPTVALIERMVASDVAEALRAEGIRVFPPVIFRAYPTPKVLILSKRNRIQKIPPDPLLDPGLTAEQREEIERFAEECDPSVSAYVAGLGGIAIFPPIVHLYPAKVMVEVAAHEWGHTYLTCFPLGLAYAAARGEVASINEIACTLLGREVVRRVRAKYGLEAPGKAEPEEERSARNFMEAIRLVREEVDRLLQDGKVEEAEAFMREQTTVLKRTWPEAPEFSQAYFAFHGKYGGASAGADPTARQLVELRQKAGSLKNFLRLIRGVWDRERFEEILARHEIQ